MKSSNKLKAITLILVIVLITILSFLGVYNIALVHGDNLVKDYSVGKDLKTKKLIRLKVDDTVNEVTYDSEGKKVEKQGEEGKYTVKQEPVNPPEVLNKENYKKAINIIEDRLNKMDAEEYSIRFNEENGIVELEMIDDELTNYILEAIRVPGEFKMIDADTKDVLMDSSFVKKTGVLYGSTSSTGTTVYLDIEFNKEGSKKLEEISKTYVKSTEKVTNAEGQTEDKTTEKKVDVKIDENSIISTSFGEALTNGHLYISVGQATTSSDDLKRYGLQASVYASMIESGKIPVVYTVENTEVIVSNINSNVIPTVAIIALVVEAIIFIVIFKLNGIIASILQIGYIALLLLVLKYTNVCITLEGLFAIILAGIINMIFIYKVLQDVKKDINVETFHLNGMNLGATEVILKIMSKFDK